MTRREQMRKSLTELDRKNKELRQVPTPAVGNKPDKKGKNQVATVAKPFAEGIGVKPPVSERKSKARDVRACARGRLPVGTEITSVMTGPEEWTCTMRIQKLDRVTSFVFDQTHKAKGLFQCLEELDLMYRKWLAENPPQSASSGNSEQSPAIQSTGSTG